MERRHTCFYSEELTSLVEFENILVSLCTIITTDEMQFYVSSEGQFNSTSFFFESGSGGGKQLMLHQKISLLLNLRLYRDIKGRGTK